MGKEQTIELPLNEMVTLANGESLEYKGILFGELLSFVYQPKPRSPYGSECDPCNVTVSVKKGGDLNIGPTYFTLKKQSTKNVFLTYASKK